MGNDPRAQLEMEEAGPVRFTYVSRFRPGSFVVIDGNTDLVATVTQVCFQGLPTNTNVEVSWMHNGDVKTAWICEWRLESAPDPKM